MAHMELNGKEIERLYVFLHAHEASLGSELLQLKARIERILYEELSIEDMERIEEERP
jgi:hypothetical protein